MYLKYIVVYTVVVNIYLLAEFCSNILWQIQYYFKVHAHLMAVYMTTGFFYDEIHGFVLYNLNNS